MSQNLINATLSPEDREAVLAAFDTIRKLLPFLRGFSPEDRRGLARMGSKSIAFVEESLRTGEQNPQLLPGNGLLSNLRQDLDLLESFQPVLEGGRQLLELMEDTELALRSDSYHGALEIYAILKVSGQAAGLDESRARLRSRFERTNGSAHQVPPPNPPPAAQ